MDVAAEVEKATSGVRGGLTRLKDLHTVKSDNNKDPVIILKVKKLNLRGFLTCDVFRRPRHSRYLVKNC